MILQPLSHTLLLLSLSLTPSLSTSLCSSQSLYSHIFSLTLSLSCCLCPSSSPALPERCEIWAQLLKGQYHSLLLTLCTGVKGRSHLTRGLTIPSANAYQCCPLLESIPLSHTYTNLSNSQTTHRPPPTLMHFYCATQRTYNRREQLSVERSTFKSSVFVDFLLCIIS